MPHGRKDPLRGGRGIVNQCRSISSVDGSQNTDNLKDWLQFTLIHGKLSYVLIRLKPLFTKNEWPLTFIAIWLYSRILTCDNRFLSHMVKQYIQYANLEWRATIRRHAATEVNQTDNNGSLHHVEYQVSNHRHQVVQWQLTIWRSREHVESRHSSCKSD